MLTAFLLQRTFVRAGLQERNATIATLALVLSPVFMILSVTFMTDIQGLFALVLCLYGCLRAQQAGTDRSAIAWIGFAVVTNVLCGTSRQISWLGVLVMVPSTLWLLRSRRPVLFLGIATTLAGALTIAWIMHWFHQQPYALGDGAFSNNLPLYETLRRILSTFMELPLLVLPLLVAFVPGSSARDRKLFRILASLIAAYILYGALYIVIGVRHWDKKYIPLLEPTLGDWVSKMGVYTGMALKGDRPPLFHTDVQLLITLVTLSSLLCFVVSLKLQKKTGLEVVATHTPTARQIAVVLVPFTVAYTVLVLSRVGSLLFDRYLLMPMVIALLFMTLFYQSRVQPSLPTAVPVTVGLFALYGILIVHDNFATYRARVVINNELLAAGVPVVSIDGGWEQNMWTQLQYSDHVNDPRILLPAHSYIPPAHDWPCEGEHDEDVPVIQPVYAISNVPDACFGPAPFAPVHYSRWPYPTPGTLYVVYAVPPRTR
jgi:hypothetical protein